MCAIDWGSIADWFAAIVTTAAVIVALYAARRGSIDLQNQLRHQAKVQRARAEEQQLNLVLAVLDTGYSEALIYGSYVESDLGNLAANANWDGAAAERRRSIIRATARVYLDRYRAFDQRLHSSAAVLRALTRTAEADAVEQVRRRAHVLFEEVTSNPNAFIGESKVAESDNAKALKAATDGQRAPRGALGCSLSRYLRREVTCTHGAFTGMTRSA